MSNCSLGLIILTFLKFSLATEDTRWVGKEAGKRTALACFRNQDRQEVEEGSCHVHICGILVPGLSAAHHHASTPGAQGLRQSSRPAGLKTCPAPPAAALEVRTPAPQEPAIASLPTLFLQFSHFKTHYNYHSLQRPTRSRLTTIHIHLIHSIKCLHHQF